MTLISETIGERKGFKSWQVDIVYRAQDGCCAECGTSLEHGFHRHHENEDASDNSTQNLKLLCPECHHAKKGGDTEKAWKAHSEKRIKALSDIDTLIEKALSGQVSGATAERIVDAIGLTLKTSYYTLDKPESVPASILLEREHANQQVVLEAYVQGLREGVKMSIEKEVRK